MTMEFNLENIKAIKENETQKFELINNNVAIVEHNKNDDNTYGYNIEIFDENMNLLTTLGCYSFEELSKCFDTFKNLQITDDEPKYDKELNLSQQQIEEELKGFLHEFYADLDELADDLENVFGQYITIEDTTIEDDEAKEYNLLTGLNNTWDNEEIDYDSCYCYIDIYYLKDRQGGYYITGFNVDML